MQQYVLTLTESLHSQRHTLHALQQVLHAASLPGVKYFHTHILLLAPGQKWINQSEMKDKPVFEIILAAVAFSWTVFVCSRATRRHLLALWATDTASTKGSPKAEVSEHKKLWGSSFKLLLLFWRLLTSCFCAAVMDEVNSELLKKITANKNHPPRKFRVERPSGSQIPLTFDSNPNQVATWLSAKGFSKP